MPLDPQVKVLLDMMKGMPSFSELSPAAARKQTSEMRAMRNAAPPPVANVENRKIPGPAGSIPVRIYTPAGSGPFPVLVYYHGGGFVIGDLESHDGVCRQLTNGAGCVTVAVDYRRRVAAADSADGPLDATFAKRAFPRRIDRSEQAHFVCVEVLLAV